ncbi:MAG: NnrU family protein [Pseudomonadota bacterium]
MILFLLGLIIFFGTHVFTSFARGGREGALSKLGEGGYKGLYSVIALIGFVLIIRGWPSADPTVLYTSPYWLRHVTYLLTLIAFVLLAAAYLPAGQIAARAKHPMLAGVKVWAFSHLLVNGDVRSIILFGSFLGYAVLARIAAKRRGAPTRAAGSVMNDLVAVGAGAVAWAGVYFYLHPIIAGVALR